MNDMKVLDYLKQLPVGEVVTNKRVLSAIKRKGLIFDYSCYGYLKSCFIYYNEECGDNTERWLSMLYLFPNGNAPRTYIEFEDGSKFLYKKLSLTCGREELNKTYGYNDIIEYKGSFFTIKYFDGCFNAFLVKCDKPMRIH